MSQSPQRLDSWKAIAQYLGRDARTAMRWHRHDGLPVHRISGGRGRAVYAYAHEIDAWLQAGAPPIPRESASADVAPAPSASAPATITVSAPGMSSSAAAGGAATAADRRGSRTRLRNLVAASLAIVLVAVALRVWIGVPAIARAVVAGDTLVAFEAGGQEVWRFGLPYQRSGPNAPSVRLVRPGDGATGVALTSIPMRQDGRPEEGEVLLVDGRGRLRWRRTLSDRTTFDGTTYGPAWFPDALVTYEVGGNTRISAAFHHHMWWPSIIVTFDEDGRVVGRFVNSGWVHSLAISADGRHLLAGGVNNALGGAVLAVIDAANPNGVSPSRAGSPICSDCPEGSPERYYVLPWSDLADLAHSPLTMVQVSTTGDIELHASQRRSELGPGLILSLSRTLDVRQRTVSDSFRQLHARLEPEGAVDHPFANCRWRVPPVWLWTPAGQWADVR